MTVKVLIADDELAARELFEISLDRQCLQMAAARDLRVSAALLAEQRNAPTRATSPYRVADIIGNSAAMVALQQRIAKLARSRAPVFISGESGSGKELVARAIHAAGPRSSKPFVAVNCGAIPGELMESEFFGHRKGSFTGATTDKAGLFQAAEGGSLFLDEIADLPLCMQVKLLRAIQEKAVRPVGSSSEVPVDIRLLSATHKNLAAEVANGHMRQDLYYRINVIEVQVPPLRERKEDVPLLTEHILAGMARAQQQPKAHLSRAALDALQNYAFPGNVRELQNILQRACALSDAATIDVGDLPECLQAASQSTAGRLMVQEQPGCEGSVEFSLQQHLENIEREAIEKALADSRWNRTAAARQLGMSFRAFRYRLKKYAMD